MEQQHFDNNKRGYITLITTLIISAVALGTVLSVMQSGIIDTKIYATRASGIAAQTLADTCVETALQTIWSNIAYTGSGTLTHNDGTCIYSVSDPETGGRVIVATGTADTVSRVIEVMVDTSGLALDIVSWQRVIY